jgi:hypothetical protein
MENQMKDERKVRPERKKRIPADELIKLQTWENHFYNCQEISIKKAIEFGMLAQIMLFITSSLLFDNYSDGAYFIAMLFSIASAAFSYFAQVEFTTLKNKRGEAFKIGAIASFVIATGSIICGFITFIN